jgi:hypothetical protein
MKKNLRFLSYQTLLAFTLVTVSQSINAFENIPPRLYFEIGLETGGDTLANEGGYSGSEISAGGGYSIAAGALLDLQGEKMDGDLLISLGFLGDDSDVADFSTTQLNLIYLFSNDNSPHRFGVGTALHINPSLKLDPDLDENCTIFCFNSSFPGGTTDFDNAVGLTLQYEYKYFELGGRDLTWGFRYTAIEYKSNVDDVDASSFGLYLNIF